MSNVLRRATAAALLCASLLPVAAFADVNEEQELNPTVLFGAAGQSVAIDGTTAVVGAPDDLDGLTLGCALGAGAAHVYTRSGSMWTKTATLCASNGALGDHFGRAVGISGNNIAVGAPDANGGSGAAYVYTYDGMNWVENATILTSGATSGGHMGTSVAIQGFRVAAGAPNTTVGGKSNTGVTVVFDSNDSGATWTSQAFRPNGGQARVGALFGHAVAVAGSTVLSGAPGFRTGSKQNSGAVFVFVNNAGSWTQQARIRPANTANVFTGEAVSLFGNTAAFGAPGANNDAGAAYVYNRSGTTWSQTDTVTPAGAASGDHFGSSVSIQGNVFTLLAVGAPDANSQAGAAYEFGSSGGAYSQLNQLIPSDAAGGDLLGTSIGLSSGRVISGAPGKNLGSGAAYVFKVRSESTTTITGFSDEPSLTGVPYTIFVSVADGSGGNGTPTGSVDLDDGNGGSCTATLSPSGDMDGHAVGQCDLTSSFFGMLTMTASYGGDANFAPSVGTTDHSVTGNHLVFNPSSLPPSSLPDVTQGESQTGVIVEVQDGANNVITGDNTTNVTLAVTNSCGDPPITLGTLQVVNGVADFSGLGPKFYTVATSLSVNASSDNGTTAVNGNINVVANADLIFPDGFEDCRL